MMESLLKFIMKSLPAISDHFSKHGKKYVAGGTVVAGAAAGYVYGKSTGHTEGKKEGTAEQAARDEKKMKEMQEKHENDRKRWNEQKQE